MTHDLDPMAQAEVEQEILRLSQALTTATEWHAQAATNHAQAEVDYKLAEARFWVGNVGLGGTVPEKSAKALLACGDEFSQYKLTEATWRAAQQKCRSLDKQLDALRSLNANVRSVVDYSRGRGG